jgi:hypothetical protein
LYAYFHLKRRVSQMTSLQMGAIPVIMDWQADALASLFNGVLFETQDRFEDVFVVLDWRSAHEHPEYVLEPLEKRGPFPEAKPPLIRGFRHPEAVQTRKARTCSGSGVGLARGKNASDQT